jgi:hypothetical protein
MTAFGGEFHKRFGKVEASAPKSGGVKLNSGKYEARVGIGHRSDQLPIVYINFQR